MNTILTDDEISGMANRLEQQGDTMRQYARAVEAAVLEKLLEQKPVQWQYREANDDGTWRAWTGCDKQVPEDAHRQCRALYAAPPPAVVQVPQDRERWLAVREGHFNAASAEYFNARQHLDTPENRRIFYAGHCKGYDAAPLPAVVQVPQGTHYPDMGSQEVPSIGSEWSHGNGDTYTVTGYADMFSENHQKRPPRVIYRSAKTGRVWSREISDWYRAMTLKVADPEAPAQGDPLEKMTRIQEELGLYNDKPAQPSVPAPWREVVKVMRTTLEDWLGDYGDCAEGGEADELVKFTRAAIALADSLEGGE